MSQHFHVVVVIQSQPLQQNQEVRACVHLHARIFGLSGQDFVYACARACAAGALDVRNGVFYLPRLPIHRCCLTGSRLEETLRVAILRAPSCRQQREDAHHAHNISKGRMSCMQFAHAIRISLCARCVRISDQPTSWYCRTGRPHVLVSPPARSHEMEARNFVPAEVDRMH